MNDAPYKTTTEVFKGRNGKIWLKQTAFWKDEQGQTQAPKKVLVELDEEAREAIAPWMQESQDSDSCKRCDGQPILSWEGYHALGEEVQGQLMPWMN